MSLRITQDRRRTLSRRVEDLHGDYIIPDNMPFPDTSKVSRKESDEYFTDLVWASAPRWLKVMVGTYKEIRNRYPDAPVQNEVLKQGDRIDIALTDGVYPHALKIRGRLNGYYDHPNLDNLVLPSSHPEHQAIFDWCKEYITRQNEASDPRSTILHVIEKSTSYRQIVRVLPSMLYFLPQSAQEDIKSAKRASRRPPTTEGITDEQATAAETWLAKALLLKQARPDVPTCVVSIQQTALSSMGGK